MEILQHVLISTIIIGICATVVMDIWSGIRQSLFGIAPPNYAMVGRWLAYMPQGRFRHSAIGAAPAKPAEAGIGWLAHYLTGIAFAGLLLAWQGIAWISQPTLGAALLVGIATVAAPFLLMQPGMGAGLAASRSPAPNKARLQSLLNHGVFGIGLYLGGWLTHFLMH